LIQFDCNEFSKFAICKISTSSDDGIDSVSLTGNSISRSTYSGQRSKQQKLFNHYCSDEKLIEIATSLGLGYSANPGSKSADCKAKSLVKMYETLPS